MRSSCSESCLKQHIENCSSNTSYLSLTGQNESIDIYGTLIKNNNISRIKNMSCFPALTDGTTDVAGTKHLKICARYLNKASNQIMEVGTSGFCSCTWPKLPESRRGNYKILISMRIYISNFHGQRYDGTSSMASKWCASQSSREVSNYAVNPLCKPLFKHCALHGLFSHGH